MLPVTISLGLINFNLLINSFFGSLVDGEGTWRRRRSTRRSGSTSCRRGSSRSRSRPCSSRPWPASRPAGRPATCGRRWRTGCGRSSSSCCPAAAAVLVLSEPMVRLVYQRGEFTPRRPTSWRRRSSGSPSRCRPTASSCSSPGPSSASSGPGCRPRSPPPTSASPRSPRRCSTSRTGSAASSPRRRSRPLASVVVQCVILRRELGGLELGRLALSTVRIAIASAALAAVSYAVWDVLDSAARALARPTRRSR